MDLGGTTTPGRAPPTTAHWPPSCRADAHWLNCDRKLPEHTCKQGGALAGSALAAAAFHIPGRAATRRSTVASCPLQPLGGQQAARSTGPAARAAGRPNPPPSVARLRPHSLRSRALGVQAVLRFCAWPARPREVSGSLVCFSGCVIDCQIFTASRISLLPPLPPVASASHAPSPRRRASLSTGAVSARQPVSRPRFPARLAALGGLVWRRSANGSRQRIRARGGTLLLL